MTALTSVEIFFFHSISPLVETHQSTRSLFSEPVRNKRSPQIAGVELPLPGSFNVQAMFLVALHVVGSPFSLEMPSLFGPRHCGQFSAAATEVNERISAKTREARVTARILG